MNWVKLVESLKELDPESYAKILDELGLEEIVK